MKIQLLYLGNKLAQHGFNKTTIETLGPALEQEGFGVHYSSDKKAFLLRLLDMIGAVFRYRKVHYVLIDTYSTKAFWYALLCSQVARLLRLKYIPILHGGNLPHRLKKNPWLSQLLFKHAYKNVAPSGYLQYEFEQAGYTNVIAIPNGLALEDYTFRLRTAFAPKLLWVRAFAAIYHPKMAVEVLANLQKTHPKASLTMVGPDKDGSLQTTKDFAASLGVSVTFTGGITKAAWWQLAAAHDIFINTTHFDNTPVSVMEAMALGLPIVSTNVGGIPYLITDKEDGILVADNQALAMTKAVEDLIAAPKTTSEMTQKARMKIMLRDWELVKQQWLQLLQ